MNELNDAQLLRYARHILLDEIGIEGQQKLINAKRIIIVGCGTSWHAGLVGEYLFEEFARKKLDRWEGNLETEAGRVTSAPYLFWNRNNPFAAGVPSMCSFQTGRGRPRDIQIRPVPLVAGAIAITPIVSLAVSVPCSGTSARPTLPPTCTVMPPASS